MQLARLASALAFLSTGCATIDPAGWDRREQLTASQLEAKPWEMFGVAPQRWLTPAGELEVVQAEAITIVGPETPGARFAVHYVDAVTPPLKCQIHADASSPHAETHGALFACTSADDAVVLTVGRGCRASQHQPACYSGALTLGDQRLVFEQGYLETGEHRIGYVSLTSPQGELVAAADIVTDMRIGLWLPAAQTSDTDRRLIQLFAALHQYFHIISERA